MLSDHHEICDPGREDCHLEYSCLGQLGDLSIDCHVPISPLYLPLPFDLLAPGLMMILCSMTSLSTPTMSVGVQAMTDLYLFRWLISPSCRRRKDAPYVDRLIRVFIINDLISADWLCPWPFSFLCEFFWFHDLIASQFFWRRFYSMDCWQDCSEFE